MEESQQKVDTSFVRFEVFGEPPSKSNSYRIITLRNKAGKPHGSLAKSPELKKWEVNFGKQIPFEYRRLELAEDLHVTLDVYLSSHRKDLDNAAKGVLDCLQKGGVIKNDRLVTRLLMRKHIDRDRPRVKISIETDQTLLF